MTNHLIVSIIGFDLFKKEYFPCRSHKGTEFVQSSLFFSFLGARCITTEIRFIQVSSLISKHSSENVKTFEKIHTFYEINQNSLNYKFIIAYQVLHRQTWISGAVKALQNCVRKTRSLLT